MRRKDEEEEEITINLADACDKEMINLLLDHGAKCDIPDSYGEILLHHLCRCDEDYEIVEILLKRGSIHLINKENNEGSTPLHCACLNGNKKVVEVLLEYGASLSIQDKSRMMTPLHFACFCRDKEVVEVLLRYGASPSLVNIDGNTPLDIAMHRGCDGIVEMINKEEERRRNVGNVGCCLLRASRGLCGSLDFPIEIQRLVISFFDEDRVLSDQQIKDVIDFGFDFHSLSNNVLDKQQFISQMKLEF